MNENISTVCCFRNLADLDHEFFFRNTRDFLFVDSEMIFFFDASNIDNQISLFT